MHRQLFLFVSVVVMGLTGCGPSNSPSVSTTETKAPVSASAPPVTKKVVGLVMKTLTNPFFIEMEKGARRAETELGVALQVKTAAQETSIEQQIQLVDDLVAAKVDAIVIAPGDSQRLVPSLKKAADAGIKIVNIDNRLDPEAVKAAGLPPVPFVSVDNEAGAYKAAKYLVAGVTKPTEAAILEGIRSADNARQRLAGARRAIEENKHVQLVDSQTANWNIDEGYRVTKAMFAKHPQIKLLFASNDMMAIGAIKYLQEVKHTDVKVVGYDALDEALGEIRNGTMLATIDQQAALQGYEGVRLAVQLIKGQKVPEVSVIDTRLVNAETLK